MAVVVRSACCAVRLLHGALRFGGIEIHVFGRCSIQSLEGVPCDTESDDMGSPQLEMQRNLRTEDYDVLSQSVSRHGRQA